MLSYFHLQLMYNFWKLHFFKKKKVLLHNLFYKQIESVRISSSKDTMSWSQHVTQAFQSYNFFFFFLSYTRTQWVLNSRPNCLPFYYNEDNLIFETCYSSFNRFKEEEKSSLYVSACNVKTRIKKVCQLNHYCTENVKIVQNTLKLSRKP